MPCERMEAHDPILMRSTQSDSQDSLRFCWYLIGMRAYSLDLRERVAAACQQPGRTIKAVAAQFSGSISFVEKLLQRQRTSGSLALLPLRGGPAPCLNASSRADVVAACASSPMPPWTSYGCSWPR